MVEWWFALSLGCGCSIEMVIDSIEYQSEGDGSELDLPELDGGVVPHEEGVVEDVHQFGGGPLRVVPELLLVGHRPRLSSPLTYLLGLN